PLRRGAPGVPIRTARAGTARGVRHRTGRAVGARRRVGGGGARMGGRVERGTRAAPERGELARRGAGGAAGTDRARDPGAGAQTARAPARRVLAQVAADSTAPPDAQALAQSALVEALIDDGQLSEAATRLGAESRLSEDDRAALRLKLARARIQRGELDLADSVLLADSSVDALALRGWVALYSGDMKEAKEMLR